MTTNAQYFEINMKNGDAPSPDIIETTGQVIRCLKAGSHPAHSGLQAVIHNEVFNREDTRLASALIDYLKPQRDQMKSRMAGINANVNPVIGYLQLQDYQNSSRVGLVMLALSRCCNANQAKFITGFVQFSTGQFFDEMKLALINLRQRGIVTGDEWETLFDKL